MYYLAGPMRGIDEFNFPAFFKAEENLKKKGYKIINPAQHDLDTNPNWDPKSNSHKGLNFLECFEWDIQQIFRKDVKGIIVLPGWEDSSGTAAEIAVCHVLNKEIIFYEEMDKNECCK